MEEDMNISEILVQITEENQTRKILEILNECENIEEAKKKVRNLLN
ncbi:MAG: protein phosphatase [Clostridiales bacterium]|nr:protein phosphatase [Clostridiales bacterium]